MSSRLIIFQTLSLYFQHQEKAGTFLDSVLLVVVELAEGPSSKVGNFEAALRCSEWLCAAGSHEEAICRHELPWPLLRPRARAMGYPMARWAPTLLPARTSVPINAHSQ